jgi:hypothetical protein
MNWYIILYQKGCLFNMPHPMTKKEWEAFKLTLTPEQQDLLCKSTNINACTNWHYVDDKIYDSLTQNIGSNNYQKENENDTSNS